jgi:methylmalonyl-CoA mutase N-terminal domain/subunit
LAGSYFVEQLTNDIEDAAWKLIDKIDNMGGAVKAIEYKFMQDEIAKSAYAYNNAIEDGSKVIVGVNKFTAEETSSTPIFRIDDSIRQVQIEKLNKLKSERNNELVAQCLAKIKAVAQTDENLMPHVIAAVEALCTLGEISDTLREIWGEYRG